MELAAYQMIELPPQMFLLRGLTVTEKEKIERGEWHDANFDEELLAKRARAEALCYDFNMGKPGSDAQLDALKTLARYRSSGGADGPFACLL